MSLLCTKAGINSQKHHTIFVFVILMFILSKILLLMNSQDFKFWAIFRALISEQTIHRQKENLNPSLSEFKTSAPKSS